jgi:dTDP-4-amino-4,6-dideoxygalactose transaminase
MDPKRVYEAWGPAAEAHVVEILRSHQYVKGAHVAGLEREFAEYVGTEHAVAVDSGTDALTLILRAVLADRPEDSREVILPTFTFVATASAVVNAGGLPRIVDVDPQTFNMAPDALAAALSPRTAAVIPVHIFGAPADLGGIRKALLSAPGVDASTVFVLEDAAQSIGATMRAGGVRRTGSLTDAGAFSLYPSKNLGAAGDGGVVTTDDGRLAEIVRALRDHGQSRKLYASDRVGTNSRMDEIQAAVVRTKLPHLDEWTSQRRAVAARYDQALAGTSARPQRILDGTVSAYHLYTIQVPERDRIREALEDVGIASGVYYPVPLHAQECFRGPRFGIEASPPCPVGDALAETVLSLPCFPGLTPTEQDRVIQALLSVLD